MAQIHEGGGNYARTRGRSTRRRSRAHVDMTAMVDVAFLLLTFFVLTAVIGKDYYMDFFKPPEGRTTPQEEQRVLSVILDEGQTAHYFVGITDPEVQKAQVGTHAFRKVLMAHIQKDPKASILVKPRYNSSYGNLVNMLDELMITSATRYALAPFTEQDSLIAGL